MAMEGKPLEKLLEVFQKEAGANRVVYFNAVQRRRSLAYSRGWHRFM